jgi:putative transposase
MPKQLKRYYGGTDLHFITFSCYRRQPYLQSSSRKSLFLEIVETVRQRYRFAVIGYVVMPEHVHLLLGEPEISDLSIVIQVLKQTVSRRVSLLGEGSVESFWQRRFYDFNVFTERKRAEKLRYMHRNPVARGLVEKPEQWQWSSFRHYASGDPAPVEIDSSWLNLWKPTLPPTLRKSAKDGAPNLRLE